MTIYGVLKSAISASFAWRSSYRIRSFSVPHKRRSCCRPLDYAVIRHQVLPFKQFVFLSMKKEATRRLDTVLARRWAFANQRLQTEMDWLVSCDVGACRDPRAIAWRKMTDVIRSVPHRSRPALAHQLISRKIRYIADQQSDDHWASPLATLFRGAGDCEDHAVLKRALLLAAGYQEADLQLLILETAAGSGHVALHVDDGRSLILDNRYHYLVSARGTPEGQGSSHCFGRRLFPRELTGAVRPDR